MSSRRYSSSLFRLSRQCCLLSTSASSSVAAATGTLYHNSSSSSSSSNTSVHYGSGRNNSYKYHCHSHTRYSCRLLSSSSSSSDDYNDEHVDDRDTASLLQEAQRVWNSPGNNKDDSNMSSSYWTTSIGQQAEARDDASDNHDDDNNNNNNTLLHQVLSDIARLELQDNDTGDNDNVANDDDYEIGNIGGRMQGRQLGVLSSDPQEDQKLLIQNYTVPSLVDALRDREELLQQCAQLLCTTHDSVESDKADSNLTRVQELLKPFQHDLVLQRRKRRAQQTDTASTATSTSTDSAGGGGGGKTDTTTTMTIVKSSTTTDSTSWLKQPLTSNSLERLRTILMRMPRRVVHAHSKRAGVVLALTNVHNVPCVLLEKRASHLRSHPNQVCLPGGMVCQETPDANIANTCLREMQEEIGGLNLDEELVVLGVLRCNWGELHHLVGMAVTPLVCFVGDLNVNDSSSTSTQQAAAQLTPNPDEVAQVFTIPLYTLLQKRNWIHRKDFAPIFVGGPHVIWGLTGYILERFAKDVLSQFHVGL